MSILEIARPLPVLTAPYGGLRLLPAPTSDPPYDDERPGGQPLPLLPSSWRPTRPLRLVPPLEDDDDPRTPLCHLPDVRPFAHALVQRLLEVLAGVRPLSQLQGLSSMEVYDGLQLLLADRPLPRGLRPERRDVRSVHVQVQGDGVAEVSATVRRGERYGALALRLEGVRGRWRCTQLLGI